MKSTACRCYGKQVKKRLTMLRLSFIDGQYIPDYCYDPSGLFTPPIYR